MPDYTEASEKLMKCRTAVMKIEQVRERVDNLRADVERKSAVYEEFQDQSNPHDAVHGRMVKNLKDATAKTKEPEETQKGTEQRPQAGRESCRGLLTIRCTGAHLGSCRTILECQDGSLSVCPV